VATLAGKNQRERSDLCSYTASREVPMHGFTELSSRAFALELQRSLEPEFQTPRLRETTNLEIFKRDT